MTAAVTVIGAGIVGCAAAYYLSRAGVDVTVIDAASIGGQASTQTAGNLHFQLSYHAMKGTEKEFRHHLAIGPINDDAEARWRELAREHPGIEVVQGGGVVVAEQPADLAALQEKARLERAAGFATEFLAGADFAAMVPEAARSVLGGSWHPREGHVNARSACHVLARAARDRGAEFLLDSQVAGLERSGRGWSVTIADGRRITAEAVVIAAGAWTEKVCAMAGVRVPMTVAGLNMGITERTGPVMTNLIMHASRPLSLKQMAAGNVMIGGGRPARLRRTSSGLGLAVEPIAASIVAGIDDMGRVVPASRSLSVIRSWQGVLGSPADELPVIGPAAEAGGLFVSTAGHTGYTLGPSCGWAVAQLVLRRAVGIDIHAFAPARFGASASVLRGAEA